MFLIKTYTCNKVIGRNKSKWSLVEFNEINKVKTGQMHNFLMRFSLKAPKTVAYEKLKWQERGIREQREEWKRSIIRILARSLSQKEGKN